MRPAVLCIATDTVLAATHNAVLAHAGYGVIPVNSAESALQVLRNRHVCAMVVGNSIRNSDRLTLCLEARRLGVPSVIIDSYDFDAGDTSTMHVNSLDGPEAFLEAVAALVARNHYGCTGSDAK